MKHLQTPPTAERVVEGDEYAVALTVDPLDVLSGLILALNFTPRHTLLMRLIRNPHVDPRLKQGHLRELAADPWVKNALTFLVDPGHCEDLAQQLDDSCTEPERCSASDCDAYAIDGGGHCGPHADAVPLRLVTR